MAVGMQLRKQSSFFNVTVRHKQKLYFQGCERHICLNETYLDLLFKKKVNKNKHMPRASLFLISSLPALRKTLPTLSDPHMKLLQPS